MVLKAEKRVSDWFGSVQGLADFFDNLTTIPPMLHYETVQRDLTHIPARFRTLHKVCVGPDGTVLPVLSPKNRRNWMITWISRQVGRFDAERPVWDHPLDGIVGPGKRGAEPASCVGQKRKDRV